MKRRNSRAHQILRNAGVIYSSDEESDNTDIIENTPVASPVHCGEEAAIPCGQNIKTYRLRNAKEYIITTVQGKPDIMIIDFQTILAGCPVLDVLYLVFTGTDEAFRRDHFDQLLRRYRSSLVKALERLGLSEEMYTEEDFEYEFKKKLPYGLFIGLLTLQVVTVDAENVPDTTKGGFESFVMKTSSLYADRINGIVSDFIKWGFTVTK